MVILFLLLQQALADIPSELVVAADESLSEESRQAAFDRVVTEGNQNVRGLIEACRDGDDTRVRWVAIRALGHVGGPQARETLLALLEDPEPAIRTAAVGALGELGDRATSRRIAEMLSDPAVLVRAAAASTLGILRDPVVLPALDDALSSTDNYYRGSSLWVRPHFVAAMGAIGDLAALPALLRALDDADPEVAATSIRSLEAISGLSFADGRTPTEESEAWRRWATTQIQRRGIR